MGSKLGTAAALALLLAAATSCKFQVAARSKPAKDLTVNVPTTAAANGGVTGAFSAASASSQKLSGTEGLAGSSVTFPPGTLAVDSAITMQEGAPLTGAAAQQLGFAAGQLKDGSTSTMIVPDKQQNPAAPFTVALQVTPAAALALADGANLIVLYQEIDYGKSAAATVGLLPPGQFTVAGNQVTFQSALFGIFQAAYAPEPVTAPKSTPTTQPTLSKEQAATVLTIAFTTTTPAIPANVTSLKVAGTVATGTQTVALFSDSGCTKPLTTGSAADFQGSGLAVTAPANASLDVYGIAGSTTASPSPCSKLVTIVTDTEAPAAPTVSVTASPTHDDRPTWTWSLPSGASGAFRYKLDNGDLTSGATETSAKTYQPASAVADGTHTLYVQAKDLAGNWSPAGKAAVTVDATAPSVTITSPATDGTYVVATTLTIAGACETGLSVNVSVDSPALSGTAVCTAGAYSLPLSLPQPLPRAGALSHITAAQTDGAGNTGSAARTFYDGLDTNHLLLWLDASDATSLSISGGTVSSWTDKSTGTSPSVFAVGSTSPPGNVTTTTITGKTMVQMDGTSYFFSPPGANAHFELASGTKSFEAFVAYRTGGSTTSTLFSRGEAGNSEYAVGFSGTDLAVDAFGQATAVPTTFASTNVTVATVRVDPTQGVTVYRNTDATAAVSTDASHVGTTASGDDFLVGGLRDTSNANATSIYAGQIGEIILYSPPPSDAERQAIAAYLKAKWGATP